MMQLKVVVIIIFIIIIIIVFLFIIIIIITPSPFLVHFALFSCIVTWLCKSPRCTPHQLVRTSPFFRVSDFSCFSSHAAESVKRIKENSRFNIGDFTALSPFSVHRILLSPQLFTARLLVDPKLQSRACQLVPYQMRV